MSYHGREGVICKGKSKGFEDRKSRVQTLAPPLKLDWPKTDTITSLGLIFSFYELRTPPPIHRVIVNRGALFGTQFQVGITYTLQTVSQYQSQ